ncbi:MAG: amino acid permease [Planctomycetota bacterium]|nr:amino acid permease [Planctomycetota bacterium]
MGWSMFLECLFATIGTGIATGAYLFFLLHLFFPGLDEGIATAAGGLFTVATFAGLQCWGAKQQAKIMEWMTYGAIVGLVWFWTAAWPGVRIERIFTTPTLPNGWMGVIQAIPFAIWWLVIIESVALAAEEAHEPHHSLPRGLLLAQLTLIVLVVLTWFFASAAGVDWRVTGKEENLFPLASVYQEVWPDAAHRPHVLGFSVIALCGMIASYNGMIFAVSRQSYSLGRAGYLPAFLGRLHKSRRTPAVSILVWSGVICGFVVWNYFNKDAVSIAVLTCNLAALVWYVLAMVCLIILRRKEPNMHRPYRVPLFPLIPVAVIAMSLVAAVIYGWMQKPAVLWLTLSMYGLGLAWYYGWARTRLSQEAPEEATARIQEEPSSRSS